MNFQEMNKWILSACALFVWGAASVRAQQPVLRFGSDKTFKIAQFTDMHLDPSKPRRLAEAEKTFARLDRILATERPDLVVFTGDVVTGAPAEGMWRRLLDTMTAAQGAFLRGAGQSRFRAGPQPAADRPYRDLVSRKPEYARRGRGAGGPGAGDSRQRLAAAAWLLYCLDSHSESLLEGIDGYDWFRPEQVAWLRDRCTARPDGQRRPCGAFAGVLPHRAVGVPRGVAQSLEHAYRTGR